MKITRRHIVSAVLSEQEVKELEVWATNSGLNSLSKAIRAAILFAIAHQNPRDLAQQ
jgi:hypothetical protein